MSRYIVMICFCVSTLTAQDSLLLSLDEVLDIVTNHHPAMRRANLLSDEADAYLLKAKAAFDPSLELYYDAKQFKDQNYYRELYGKLKLPTRFGPEFSVGYEVNNGQFLDSSDNLPDNGLANFGVMLPLGNGLLFDERRANLRDAQIFARGNQLEQQLFINQVKVMATLSYLRWQLIHEQIDVFNEAISLAQSQLGQVRSSFIEGDKPAIDTLEYSIILQSRIIEQRKADQERLMAQNDLSQYIWSPSGRPLSIADDVIPTRMDDDLFDAAVDSINLTMLTMINDHPMLRQYDLKLEKLDVQQRLNREFLKPDLNLTFNPLVQVNPGPNTLDYAINDYKIGIDFYYPIFTRKARAEIRLTDIERQNTNLDRAMKQQELEIKLRNIINNDLAYREQMALSILNVAQYFDLLRAERIKFRLGESTVFLLNSREQKYLDAKLKLLELRNLYLQNKIKLLELSVADF